MEKDYMTCAEMREFLSKPGMKNKFGTGALETRYDDRFQTRILFKSNSKKYPAKIDNHEMNNGTVNQGSYGICYCCATVHYAEYLVWRVFGKKIAFTFKETLECASDYYGYSYKERKKKDGNINCASGGHFCPKNAYDFNDNLSYHYFTEKAYSEKFELFHKAVDKIFNKKWNGEIKSIDTRNQTEIQDLISRHGSAYFSFDMAAWGQESGNGHAILATGYDSRGIYCLNSWGSRVKKFFSWSELSKYGWGFNCLNPTQLTNLD